MTAKEKIGIVVSDKMKDTRIVAVNDRIIHKRYKKVVTRTKRYAVQIHRAMHQLATKYVFVKRNQLVKQKIGS